MSGINTKLSYIYKRLFIEIPFNNKKPGSFSVEYEKLTIPQKFQLIKELVNEKLGSISKKLKITSIDFEKETPFNNIIFFTAYTEPKRNHPFIGYMFKTNNTNKIVLIRAIGKSRFYADTDQYQFILDNQNGYGLSVYLKNYEVYALYLSVIKSIVIRKEEMISNPDFSLLKCSNIKECKTKKTKKKGSRSIVSKSLKGQKPTDQPEYRKKAIAVIIKYFDKLEEGDIDDAIKILGKTKIADSEINRIFKTTKRLRGHLEVFISLYEIVELSKKRFVDIFNYIGNYLRTVKTKDTKTALKTFNKSKSKTFNKSKSKTFNKSKSRT